MIAEIIEFLIYAILPYYKRKKRREEEWHGIVDEKLVKRGLFFLSENHYVVFVTSEGRKIRMKLSEQEFLRFEKGIRYFKKRGEDLPGRI